MKRDELRLELLKIAHTHGREPAQIVERAKILEVYVGESIPDSGPVIPSSSDVVEKKEKIRKT